MMFRDIKKSHGFVTPEKIHSVLTKIQELGKDDPKAEEYFDFHLARAEPSGEYLRLWTLYRAWGVLSERSQRN